MNPGQLPEPDVEIIAEVVIFPDPDCASPAPLSIEMAVKSSPYSAAVFSKNCSSVRMLTSASISMSVACCSGVALRGVALLVLCAGIRILDSKRPINRM